MSSGFSSFMARRRRYKFERLPTPMALRAIRRTYFFWLPEPLGRQAARVTLDLIRVRSWL
jgi:hypothetical protein